MTGSIYVYLLRNIPEYLAHVWAHVWGQRDTDVKATLYVKKNSELCFKIYM